MIERVEIVNWRGYERREVAFGPGLTFLVGPNGAGKTSLLSAIAYALTGELSSAQERAASLRDPGQVATVRLWLEANGEHYLIERSQAAERAGGARLSRDGERDVLASNQKGVTAAVESITGVSADFLRRIVYMAEGDVFRFLDRPPGARPSSASSSPTSTCRSWTGSGSSSACARTRSGRTRRSS